MRNLYCRTEVEFPENFIHNEVTRDIKINWKPYYNLFSFSQLCSRHSISKRSCRRKIKKLFELGIVELHS